MQFFYIIYNSKNFLRLFLANFSWYIYICSGTLLLNCGRLKMSLPKDAFCVTHRLQMSLNTLPHHLLKIWRYAWWNTITYQHSVHLCDGLCGMCQRNTYLFSLRRNLEIIPCSHSAYNSHDLHLFNFQFTVELFLEGQISAYKVHVYLWFWRIQF